VDPRDPQDHHDHDQQQRHAREEHDHVALALTAKMARADGRQFHVASVRLVLHAPDGRLIDAGSGFGRAAGFELLLQLAPFLRENPFLLLEFPPLLFERIGVIAVLRHGGRLAQKSSVVAWIFG